MWLNSALGRMLSPCQIIISERVSTSCDVYMRSLSFPSLLQRCQTILALLESASQHTRAVPCYSLGSLPSTLLQSRNEGSQIFIYARNLGSASVIRRREFTIRYNGPPSYRLLLDSVFNDSSRAWTTSRVSNFNTLGSG